MCFRQVGLCTSRRLPHMTWTKWSAARWWAGGCLVKDEEKDEDNDKDKHKHKHKKVVGRWVERQPPENNL